MKKTKENIKGWTRYFRDDIGIWEEICPHGVTHSKELHDCDGCCFEPDDRKN